ncbi:MAG: DUF2341 domain-containing protein [Bacteroidales bacterium]|nr:DUF2341 domain-containing protein [Bacteroidales bacterium]
MKAPGNLLKTIPVLFLYVLLSIPLMVSGQTTGDYRTNATGTWNWNTAANWQRWNGSAWVAPGNYPGQAAGAGTVNILDNTTVTVSATVPNPVGALSINGGGNDSYVQFSGSFTLTVTGQTYLNSTSNGDEKSILVDAGVFSTGTLSANSNGDTRDAYLRISTGSATVTGNITLNASNIRTYVLFTGTGSLYVGGSISGGGITSTAGGAASAPTSGTVVFNGSSAQTLGNYTYYNITVNNASGVSLPGNITVNNSLTMTQGNIDAGSNTLAVTGSLSYTSGTVIGKLRRNLTATGTEYLFPVGTASSYNPFKITFTNLTAGTLTASYQAADIGTSGLPLNDAGNWIHDRQTTGYWTLTAGTLASTNYSVKLNYTGYTDVDSRARVLKRTNGGNLALDGSHGSVASPEISRTGMSGISTTTTDLAIGKPHPRFTTHPSDFVGCTATFQVVVSGTAPLTYRWQENSGGSFVNISDGGIYSGSGTATLVLTGATTPMSGYQYRCVVTDTYGYTVTSNSATLTVPVVTFGYDYQMDVTLDPASGSQDLTDFPALVSITSSNLRTVPNGGHVWNSSGYDVIFTDQDGSRLDHQLEYYDAATGQYIAWVRIPVLSYSSSTTIRMMYGNQAVISDPSVQSVWVSSFKGVWHLNGTSFTDDATDNGNNGTNNATTAVTGRIAGGRGFNGTTSYIMTPANGFVDNDNNQTISIWANYSITPSGNRNLMSFQNSAQSSAIQLGFRGGNAVAWKWGGAILADGGAAPSTNTWHYYVYVYDGTTSYIYIDGVLKGSSTVAPQTYKPTEGDIGRYNDGEYLAANLDEARFSMSPKSAGWVMTEYLNQYDPANFISLGSETASTLLASVGVCSTTYPLDQGYPPGGNYSGTGVSGTNFNASVAGVGTHVITYSSAAGCPGSPSKNIIVTPVPSAPSAANLECCITNIADLTASGTNLKWYSDAGLTTLEGTGTPFATGETTAGTYTYYVTQTINGCESPATTVSLTIHAPAAIISQPSSVSICAGNNAEFMVTASGYNLNYQWQENGSNLSDGGVYSGVNTSALLLTNPGSALSGRVYRCVITTTCGASPLTSSGATLTISNDNTWTGTADTDWNNTTNWGCGSVPLQPNNVIIPDVTNKPVLSSGSAATVNNLTIASGSSLVVSGNTIRITGAITNSGTFDATAGTIDMNGTSAQQIPAGTFSGNTIQSLVISNAAGVTLLGPLNVTGSVSPASGSLASDGNLTLVSTIAGTAYIDGSGSGQVTGSMTMQRYLSSAFGYRYISSPFSAETVNGLSDEVNLGASFPPVYKYDENRTASGWVSYVKTDSLLRPLHGYSVNFGAAAVPLTVDITGQAGSGAVSRTLYNHNYTYTKGFNLVGNPYPSAIDWNAASGWTKTNIDNALYFFKPGTTDQYGGTYSTYVNGVSSDGIVNNIIPSMQGFFVHVTNGIYPVTGLLSMNNSVRVNNTTQQFSKSEYKSEGSILRLAAAFEADTAVKDYMMIYDDVKASDNFDSELDALKLMNTDLKVPNLYSLSGDSYKLSINGIPEVPVSGIRMPLGVKANTAGTVIFKLKSASGSFAGLPVSLYDSATGTTQSLDNNGEYSINLPLAEYLNRFFLDINYITTDTREPGSSPANFSAWVSGGVVVTHIYGFTGREALLNITNLTGQTLVQDKIYQPGRYEYRLPLNSGLYFITLSSAEGRSVQKLIINR